MKQDLLYETYMLCYWGPQWKLVKLTQLERGKINAGLKQLREIEATPEQLERKFKAYEKRWPSLGKPSLLALVGNWSRFDEVIKPKQPKPSYHDLWERPSWMK